MGSRTIPNVPIVRYVSYRRTVHVSPTRLRRSPSRHYVNRLSFQSVYIPWFNRGEIELACHLLTYHIYYIGSYGTLLYDIVRFEVKTISMISTTRYGYKNIHRNTLCSSNRHVNEALKVGNCQTSDSLFHHIKSPPHYFPHFYLLIFYHGRNSISLFLYPWVYL